MTTTYYRTAADAAGDRQRTRQTRERWERSLEGLLGLPLIPPGGAR